jgi:serine/threonine-protein kinase
MGVVYGAEDPLLSRKVAIKTILMSADPLERAEYEPRFYQEAKAAGSLNHPNIITIYDIGREGDMAFMAMELIEGVELRALIMNNQLSLYRALHIAAQVAEGIASAHEKGVIHRDIKPGNVMVLRGDVAKIMDFGIARLRTSDVKTATGMLLGSPKYMSPEQIIGKTLDHRSDIFSLGVVIYEMATGSAPFSGPDLPALMHAITGAEPAPPSRLVPGVPHLLDLILAKALAKKVDERYQDARELAADLRACRDALPPEPAPARQAFEQTMKLDRAAPGDGMERTQPLGTGTLPLGAGALAPGAGALPPGGNGLLPLGGDTVPLEQLATDPSMISTVPLSELKPLPARPAAPAASIAHTATTQATPRASAGARNADPRYAVNTRFDPSATLMKLRSAAPAAPVQDATIAGTTRRLRKSPERMIVAIAIVVAIIAAVLIAVL